MRMRRTPSRPEMAMSSGGSVFQLTPPPSVIMVAMSTDVDIECQPEAVRQFFETLEMAPNGLVVKLNGKPLARVLPAEGRKSEWSEAKNVRRCELIERDIAGTMTPDETLELEV